MHTGGVWHRVAAINRLMVNLETFNDVASSLPCWPTVVARVSAGAGCFVVAIGRPAHHANHQCFGIAVAKTPGSRELT